MPKNSFAEKCRAICCVSAAGQVRFFTRIVKLVKLIVYAGEAVTYGENRLRRKRLSMQRFKMFDDVELQCLDVLFSGFGLDVFL